MTEMQMRGLEDIECYQLATKVMREAYRIAGSLRSPEEYDLADQLRRAAVSCVLNIAEGYGLYRELDCIRFYSRAQSSLMEVLSAMTACDGLHYTSGELSRQRELCDSTLRSINGCIRDVRGQRQGTTEYGDRVIKEDSVRYRIDELATGDLPPEPIP
jgi:four helix bundle protein